MLPPLKLPSLCTGNSCRSQMAEAWTRSLHGDRIVANSAGTAPRAIDARTTRVMAEAGIDISGQRPKSLAEVEGISFDAAFTVGDSTNESCPVFPGLVLRIHAGFDDPPRLAAQSGDESGATAVYRRVHDEIRAFVETLPRRLA